MIFNMSGGGGIAGSGSGAGLNFKVVGGTTQPSNPSENTIWVNTDKEIAGWIFSAKNPFIGEIVESASVLSGTVGTSVLNKTGYSFRKVNDGKAVMAFFNSDSSVGVMLVSRDRDACKISKVPKITTIDTTTTIEAKNSFIYDGETYYYAYILFNKTMYYILDAEPIDCTSYAVLANALAPTYNIDNKVWIKSGEISTVSFNALKKNGIIIYPLCAKQYIDGTWVGKTAKSYQEGEWVEWMNDFILVDTNGVREGYTATGSNSTTVTVNANDITVYHDGGNGSTAKFNWADIDVTEYGIMEFTISGSGTIITFFVGSAATTTVTTTGTYEVDISQVSGAQQIGFNSQTASFTVTDWRLKH